MTTVIARAIGSRLNQSIVLPVFAVWHGSEHAGWNQRVET